MADACVEVLIPDFQGNKDALKTVLKARPDVLNHNIETVPRLYPLVRPQAEYQRSLDILRWTYGCDSALPTKSGLMLGLGEEQNEVENTLEDLRAANCRILTLGQYLQPSKNHLPVERFIPPEEFDEWRKKAIKIGFTEVASGPFVRSSYHAKELYQEVSV
jgi:lipoic acid synthetase